MDLILLLLHFYFHQTRTLKRSENSFHLCEQESILRLQRFLLGKWKYYYLENSDPSVAFAWTNKKISFFIAFDLHSSYEKFYPTGMETWM